MKKEINLSLPQKQCLEELAQMLGAGCEMQFNTNDLSELWGLNGEQALKTFALFGLALCYSFKDEGSSPFQKEKQQLQAIIINGSPGSRILYDAEHGFIHNEPGRSWNGRNNWRGRNRFGKKLYR